VVFSFPNCSEKHGFLEAYRPRYVEAQWAEETQSTQPSDSALLQEQKNSPMEDLEAYPVHDLEADHASDAHHQASAGTTS
jgi:hypothetical protein